MATTYTFRNFSVFKKSGKKLDFTTQASLTATANGELIIGDGMVLGRTAGVPTCKASLSETVCVEGNDSFIEFLQSMAQTDSTQPMAMTFGVIGGNILTVDMWVEDAAAKADMAKGHTTGDINLVGRFPSIKSFG